MMDPYLIKCAKLMVYNSTVVTLETFSGEVIQCIVLNESPVERVVIVMTSDKERKIPLDDIKAVRSYGMETLYFEEPAKPVPTPAAQPAVQEKKPAAAPAVQEEEKPAAAPAVQEEEKPAAAPAAEEHKPARKLLELLEEGSLQAALAMAQQPETMQSQGYTDEEAGKIIAALRADKLPTEQTPYAIARRLWRVLGNHGGAAEKYAEQSLPEGLPLCYEIAVAEKHWDRLEALGAQYTEQVCADGDMLHTYAYALLQCGREDRLLDLTAQNPVVLHQKSLYPALKELAQRRSDDHPEAAALVAAAAPYVEAYPDREVRTPLERILLGDYDEEKLRPYRGEGSVELLCRQGYTEKEAAYITERMTRVTADTYKLERGTRLAYVQGNIHYLSEYYLWEELLTSPEDALFRLSVQLVGAQDVTARREEEYLQLYRYCVAPNAAAYDSDKKYAVRYLNALLHTGQEGEALDVAQRCWSACTETETLNAVAELAKRTDPVRFAELIRHCELQRKNHKANEFEQMLMSMDRRMMDFVNRPEQLEQLGYDKATVKRICNNLPKVNNYPSGNAPYQQYERVYYVQGNANNLAERCLQKAIRKEADPQRKKQLNAIMLAMLCKEQSFADAYAYLPDEADMLPEMYKTTSLWYFRALYAAGDYKRYCALYDSCRNIPKAAICSAGYAGVRSTCETVCAQAQTGHALDALPTLLELLRNPAAIGKPANRGAISDLMAVLSRAEYLPVLAQVLSVIAEQCFRNTPQSLRTALSAMLPEGREVLPEEMADALRRAENGGEQAWMLLVLLGMADADEQGYALATEWFIEELKTTYLGGKEKIDDSVNPWIVELWPMAAQRQLSMQLNMLANFGWLYIHQELTGSGDPSSAFCWLINPSLEATIPIPAGYPEDSLKALASYVMKSNVPGRCKMLLQKYPELSQYGLRENPEEEPAPAEQPVQEPEADAPQEPTEAPAEAEKEEPSNAQSGDAAAGKQEINPAEQFRALLQQRKLAVQRGDEIYASLYLQTLCRSECLFVATDVLTRGALLDEAAKEPPMLQRVLQYAEQHPDGVDVFLKQWRVTAAEFISFDFSEQVTELMLQINRMEEISKDEQDTLVWAVLTNSDRKNAAWGILQLQNDTHARALTTWCAAVDGAVSWMNAVSLFWQTKEYMLFLRGLVHRFGEQQELAERLVHCDHLREMCEKHIFDELDKGKLLEVLKKLYPVMAQSYCNTESWTIVQTIRYVSFQVGGDALKCYYDVFAEQYAIITKKLPMEGCAFLAQLGSDPKTRALMDFLKGSMLRELADPAPNDGVSRIRLPQLLRKMDADLNAEPCRCSAQEEQDVYSLILPDASNWSWMHYNAYFCRRAMESPAAKQEAIRVLYRFAEQTFEPDGFLLSIGFFEKLPTAKESDYKGILQLVKALISLKAEAPAGSLALYAEYNILWAQLCGDDSVLEINMPPAWLQARAKQYAELYKNAPMLHKALATGNWEPCLQLLMAGGEEADNLRTVMIGAISAAAADKSCISYSTVWQSLARTLVGRVAHNLQEGAAQENQKLKKLFSSLPTLPNQKTFRELLDGCMKALEKADEDSLRWVEVCTKLPLEETQFFRTMLDIYQQDCSREQAELRSELLELMGTRSSCSALKKLFIHAGKRDGSPTYGRAIGDYNDYLANNNTNSLYHAIQKGFQAADLKESDLCAWAEAYEALPNSRFYFGPTAKTAEKRALYRWIKLLTKPEEFEKKLPELKPKEFVNLVGYMLCRSDRATSFPTKYYPLLLPEQIAAVQALIALILFTPNQLAPYMEKLQRYPNGNAYVRAIDSVLKNSMCSRWSEGYRIAWDEALCKQAEARNISYQHTDRIDSGIIRLPADINKEKEGNVIAKIRARIRGMLNICTEEYVFADPGTVCMKAAAAAGVQARAVPAIVAGQEPDEEEAENEGLLVEEEQAQRTEQCCKRIEELFSSEAERIAFRRTIEKETNLSCLYLAGAVQLTKAEEPAAGSILRCLLDAAKSIVPNDKLDSFSRILVRVVELTPYRELEALREQLRSEALFERLEKGAASSKEEQNKRRSAYNPALRALQEYLQPLELRGFREYDKYERKLKEEDSRCEIMERTRPENDPYERLRILAKKQRDKLAKEPQMNVELIESSAYYCTRAQDDYDYDDPCEPTTLQGYVENVGGRALQPVSIILSYRIESEDGTQWDESLLPAQRKLVLRGPEGNAVLPAKQQYTDAMQKALWHIPFQIDTDLPEKLVEKILAEKACVTASVEVRAIVQGENESLLYRSELPLKYLPETKDTQVRVKNVIRDPTQFFGRRSELAKLHDAYCEGPERIPMLYLISGQYRMGKTMIAKRLQEMIRKDTGGQVIPLRLEVVQSSGGMAASENLKELFADQLWEQVEAYFQDEELPPEYRDEASLVRLHAHCEKWRAYFASRSAQTAAAPQSIQYLPDAADDDSDEDTASLDISSLSAGLMQGSVQEDLRWLPRLCRELCAALGNRHIVYILDEADRLVTDLETVGGAAASNLRAVLQSEIPFHLVLCGANGLTEYYLRGGSMTQLFECTYGRPMIIGQMTKDEWCKATSTLIDKVQLDKVQQEESRTQEQLWFYTRGLIHPAYCLMDACFSYLDNSSSVQPAPDGKATLYAARMLEATNAILCSSPQQLHMDKLTDNLSDDYDDLWRTVLICLIRECTVPYQWVSASVLESIVDESAGITWDKISNVLSNLVSYRGLLEYSPARKSYRPQCELYRQILRNKLLNCKLQPYPYFKPIKENTNV